MDWTKVIPSFRGPFHLTMDDRLALAQAPKKSQIPWWDFEAKRAAGHRIADEEAQRAKAAAFPAKPAV